MKERWRVVAVVVLAAALAPSAAAAAATKRYVVQLKVDPLASYRGGRQGLPATSPRVTGRKLDRSAAAVLAYRALIARRQSAALARLGADAPEPLYSYRWVFAGFAADLTPAQVRTLQAAPEVAHVFPHGLLRPMSLPPAEADALLGGAHGDGASYLRLPNGLWQRLGGTDHAGEGVIVGVIDTGITPEHPSFADNRRGYIGRRYAPPEVWDGACQAGERFNVTDCNNKLIGARYFVEGFGADNLNPNALLSPRDDDGHGTHTASTAAGNFGVDPVVGGNDLGMDRISGIAPRAYVAAYKACWVGSENDGCDTVDTVAAIDTAVADGVDVINFSIGSDTSTVIDPDALAFLGAADAGVFVATSAGNAGPGESTVGSPTGVPWVTSVAAATLARSFEATATIVAGGTTLSVTGASVTQALPAAPLIDAATAARPGVQAADAELCKPGTLDPAKVTGAVVLCKRGDNPRVEKSKVVRDAGGVGMILYNAAPNQELVTDTHWVPSVHISFEDGLRVKALAAQGATASLTSGRAVALPRGGILAAFSSRGPQTGVPDIAKPDVTAPGVNILAGASPFPAHEYLRPGELFQSISGTSMSAPHVAGAAALLTQLHPTFSPAALKSSLMTTADPDVLQEDAKTPATPFDAGSGEIDPNRAADPGLVLEATTGDYISYLRSVAPFLFPEDDPTPVLAPADVNLASISFGSLAGAASTTRRFTSVDATAHRWRVSVEGLPGIAVSVSPTRFTIKPGQTVEVSIALTRVDAPIDAYAAGALVLRDGERTVRLPITVRPVALSAPARLTVQTDAASGSLPFSIVSGVRGPLSALGWGLARPQTDAGRRISATTGAPDLSGTDPGTQLYPVTVPAEAQLLAARLQGAAGTDIDLYLYRDPNADGDFSDATLVDLSAGPTSHERIERLFPEAGAYVLAVVGFLTEPGGSLYDVSRWLVADPQPDDPAPPPGLVISGDPVDALIGEPVTFSLDWSGLDQAGTYLGVATYHEGATPAPNNLRGSSVVEITRSAAAVSMTLDASAPPAAGAADESVARSGQRPASPRPAIKVRLVGVRAAGRSVVLKVRAPRATALRIVVSRSSKTVGRARVRATGRPVRVTLRRALTRGHYTVRIAATRNGSTASVVRSLRVG